MIPLKSFAVNQDDVDPLDATQWTNEKRSLGLVVCRSTAVISIAPQQGYEEIDNPFEQDE